MGRCQGALASTRPEFSFLDPLSDILTMLAVRRAVPVRFESSGRYAMRFGSYQHLKFGAVLSGHLDLSQQGHAEGMRFEEGDCYLLTDGLPFRTGSVGDSVEIDGDSYFATHRTAEGIVRFGDSPPDKVVLSGRFVFDDEGAAWLRSALPPVIPIKAGAPEAEPLRATLALLGREVGRGAPGEGIVIDRLADILLVQALRAHLNAAGPHTAGWLSGIADPRLGRAMRAVHADVARQWTVASLAAEAGMSRSSFAERFRARVGLSPLDYLARWRMLRVKRALIDTDLPFGVIAARNGYLSRTSCSQTFKRVFGYAPGSMRAASTDDALPNLAEHSSTL